MASVYDVVDALHAMGLEMKAIGVEAEKTAVKVKEAMETTSGMPKAGAGATATVGSTSLGDPRNAEDQAARIHAAIEAAKRR